MSSLLVVCTGNICRSPVGEAAFAALLEGGDIAVSSAGTRAVVDAAAEPEVQEFLRRELDRIIEHRARQLTEDLANSAGLIVTMTENQRAWVARTAPRTVRRIFTAKELALLVAELTPGTEYADVKTFALAVSRLRARARDAEGSLDIDDPYRGTPQQYEESFKAVLAATSRIADAIADHVPSSRAGGPTA